MGHLKCPSAADDLGWLFNASESEMGVRSNYPHALLALAGKAPKRVACDVSGALVGGVWDAEDSAIAAIDAKKRSSRPKAAARLNRVMGRYRRLPHWAKVVLEAAYEARQLPPGLRGETGQGQWALLRCFVVTGRRPADLKRGAVALLEKALRAYEAT